MNRRLFLTAAALSMTWLRSLGAQARSEDAPESAEGHTGLSADPLRPSMHLLPAANWMNDPCAPRFYAGKYHVFYQYNPGASVWGDMHWAHATSADLVHWTHEAVALAPSPDGPDAAGCFTGSVLPGTAMPTIIYTGVTKVESAAETIPNGKLREVQCMATSDGPMLDRWTKLPEPVLAAPPAGLEVVGFRDPSPWRDGDTWYMVVGSGLRGKGGMALLYRSKDGRAWEYLHPLVQGTWNGQAHADPVDSGEMWECPDFFSLGGLQVLLYSTERKVYWQTGRLDRTTMRFRAKQHGMLDVGAFYAPKSMLDAAGRRILWGWVPETRSVEEYRQAGWAGMMALPRVLTLTADGRLQMEPVPELAQLLKPLTQEPSAAAPNDQDPTVRRAWTLPARQGHVRLEMQTGVGAVDLRFGPVGAAEDAEPMLQIVYEPATDARSVMVGSKRLALRGGRATGATVEVWVDGSVAEVFVDRLSVTTERFYVRPDDALQIACASASGAVSGIVVSEGRPISRDRLTT